MVNCEQCIRTFRREHRIRDHESRTRGKLAVMRKRLITPIPQTGTPDDEGWLDLDRAAVVEVTSEEKEYPIEAALISGEMRGWRAADSGTQTIRLIFDEPQRLTRISLVFEETETERTQEFVLRLSGDGGRSFRKIVRQQWNFSPPNTIREVEEYQVEITNVTVLELVIAGHQSRSGSRLAQESASVLTSLSTHGRRDACTGTLPRGAHTRSFEHPTRTDQRTCSTVVAQQRC